MITAQLTAFSLPLTKPLSLAGGVLRERAGILLTLTHDSGIMGYGEATPWNTSELAAVRRSLEEALPAMAGLDPHEAGLDLLPRPAHPAARFALEGAWLDLQSRLQGVPLSPWLGADGPPRGVALNGLIGQVVPEEAGRLARAHVRQGYRTLKVKLGRSDFAADLAVLQAVRDAVDPSVRLRGDVNAAWSEQEARDRLPRMGALDLEYVEQPVAEPEAMARLRKDSPMALAADESLSGPDAVDTLLRTEAADVWVLKPTRFGGFRDIEAVLGQAHAAGIPVTLTGMFEGAVATATLLHLAMAWLPADTVCGLTPGLFSGGFNTVLPTPQGATWTPPAGPGIGVSPSTPEGADA